MAYMRIESIQSAMVDAFQPNTNFSSGAEMQMGWGYSNENYPVKGIYIKFNKLKLAKKRLLFDHKIYVFLKESNKGSSSTMKINYAGISSEWNEKNTSWNYSPAVDVNEITTIQTGPGYKCFKTINGNVAVYGMCLRPATVRENAIIYSSRAGINAPYAEIEYENVIPLVTVKKLMAGLIYFNTSNKFEWEFSYDETHVIDKINLKYSEFQWRNTANIGDVKSTIVYDNNVTIEKNTFKAGFTEWRVRVIADTGEYSAFSPWYRLETIALPVYVGNLNPNSGFIDEKQQQKFEWELIADKRAENVYLKSSVFQWRNAALPDSINAITTGLNCVFIPPNTFPNGAVEWRVKVISNEDTESDFSNWIYVSTKDVATTNTSNLLPDLTFVKGDVENKFSWYTNSPIGSVPKGYNIRYSYDKISIRELANKTTGYERFFTVPANTFNGDIVYWQVRTYNSDGVAGTWSEFAQITIATPPQKPNIVRVSNENMPVVQWIAAQQSGYQIQILKNNIVVFDTEMKGGMNNSYRITKPLEYDNYMLQIRVINEFDMVSEWETYMFTIKKIDRFRITHTETIKKSCIKINWETTSLNWLVFDKINFNDFYIYRETLLDAYSDHAIYYIIRDGMTIAKIKDEKTFTDYTCYGKHEYIIRRIENYTISDSDKFTVEIELEAPTVAPLNDPQSYIAMKYSLNRYEYEKNMKIHFEKTFVSGRESAQIIYAENSETSSSFTYVEMNKEKWFDLLKLYKTKLPLVLRTKKSMDMFIITELGYGFRKNVMVYTIKGETYDFESVPYD